MTPTHRDSPLRRSEIGAFRTPIQNVLVNDDEEERRQARRRTIIENSATSIRLEDNETLKNCLKIYSENKLSKENAWSLSLIDTLSTLLQGHHKSLSNFKVAGSSLEASSKVYGLRVDSIHTDVLRMTAGLNKQKINEENEDLDESGHQNKEDANASIQNEEKEDNVRQAKAKKKRKAVSTITKNKDTICGRLDTVPLTDPIFGKVNAMSGNINSSNRLLQNILLSKDSELQLKMENKFWDSSEVPDLRNLDEAIYESCKTENCDKLLNKDFDNLVLRANHTGYVISNIPDRSEEGDKNAREKTLIQTQQVEQNEQSHLSVAFDMQADSEPIHMDNYAVMDVDLGDMDDLTVDEQVAINNCKGLRRAPIIIEDLRPTDSTSNLEYSYRPLDKISRFWAGPSHWKFKKMRNSSIIQGNSQFDCLNKPAQKAKSRSIRFRAKQVNFGETHDDLFQKLEDKNKIKKVNLQKKWDAKKLKLPTDLQIDKNIFDVFRYAPGIAIREKNLNFNTSLHDDEIEENYDDDNLPSQDILEDREIDNDYEYGDFNNSGDQHGDNWNHTIVEIGSDFAGAPDKIMKIIVPFATRAKVVNMKQLKKCCIQLINTQIITSKNVELPAAEGEVYIPGKAKFSEVYERLPNVLTKNMSESLSPSVAFYSILHLANEFSLRIIPQENLEDFQILQLELNEK